MTTTYFGKSIAELQVTGIERGDFFYSTPYDDGMIIILDDEKVIGTIDQSAEPGLYEMIENGSDPMVEGWEWEEV